MMAKRIRSVWQRTPKIMREVIDESQLLLKDQDAIIERLKGEVRVKAVEISNLKVQRDEVKYALKVVTDVEKIDVVIPALPEHSATYYVVNGHTIFPVFGTQPGDKILLARKKVL
jgi:hypothetical protein